ncbi:rod shape-determining protein MreD [Croceiramulus getboli]|nr:rod shape-determining protein MreD [Flavobacteriaceae bacterium YJPT1-3]
MNNNITRNLLRFVLLVLLQVTLFNHINFSGFINPYPYLLYVALFPISGNRSLLLFSSFLLGLSVDMFANSGGVHAAACLIIAFLRPVVLRFSFGVSYEYNTVKLSKVTLAERFVYLSILTLIHHFVLFSLEIFNVSDILLILKNALSSSIFTIILSLIFVTLFSVKRS